MLLGQLKGTNTDTARTTGIFSIYSQTLRDLVPQKLFYVNQ